MGSDRTNQAPMSGPVPRSERIATLDVLRGFALLGILLVNIELFRGPAFWDVLAGEPAEQSRLDAIASFGIGWLASGKFLSSFAIMFGVGAAIMGGRALSSGRSPRGLLARRYLWLGLFGVVHMFLLFSGDILFLYAVAGLLLLPFLFASPRALLWWSAGLVAVYLLLTLGAAASTAIAPTGAADDAFTDGFTSLMEDRREQMVAAYTGGGPVAQVQARAWEVAFVQGGQLLAIPWVLALFLLGFALGKQGFIWALPARGPELRRAALVGLGLGLPLNLPLGMGGVLGTASPDAGAPMAMAMALAQAVGAPLLAVGYLSALALACGSDLVRGLLGPLEAAGRMALSGYMLQSVLATGFFVWLRFYDRLGTAQALVVVVVIWAVVLTTCSWWQRRTERGPLEALWRRLTYGRPVG